MMSSRFTMSSEEEINVKKELGVASHDSNANTKRSTRTWVNVYQAWATWRGKKCQLEEYTVAELNDVLATFYCEVRKSDGSDYEPDCLRVMQSSLYRYLSENNYPKSIVSDTEFKSSQDVLEGKIKRLRMEGKGKKPTSSKIFSQEVEERLWQLNKLGHHSPLTLIHTMWFNNTKYFGIRGRENHVAITMENFTRKVDENGVRYIEVTELPTTMGQHVLYYHNRVKNAKMFAKGGRRCPVALFDFYVSKRPSEMENTGRFYLSPRQTITNNDEDWYRQCPMGKNTLSRILRNILDDEGVRETIENPGSVTPTPTLPGVLIDRMDVDEDSEYAIIKVPRNLKRKLPFDYDDNIPTMLNVIPSSLANTPKTISSSISSSTNAISLASQTISTPNGSHPTSHVPSTSNVASSTSPIPSTSKALSPASPIPATSPVLHATIEISTSNALSPALLIPTTLHTLLPTIETPFTSNASSASPIPSISEGSSSPLRASPVPIENPSSLPQSRSNLFPSTSSIPAISTAYPSSPETRRPTASSARMASVHYSSDKTTDGPPQQNGENFFKYVDEKGTINVFYNCNVTIIQGESSRKRKGYTKGDSSSEE